MQREGAPFTATRPWRIISSQRRREATPDIPGADPRSGPLAFKGPGTWKVDNGFYSLVTKRQIDWVEEAEGEAGAEVGAFAAYLGLGAPE